MGVQRSTYYRWKRQVDRWGLEALNIRERRKPRMPNEIGPHLEQRIIAFSLAHPGFGPRRISAELAREKWGAIRISEHGIWRVLCRVGLNTRGRRLALIARHRDRYERAPSPPLPERAHRRREARRRWCRWTASLSAGFRAARARCGRYTAIDVASGYTWAELHSSGERNPRSRHCQTLLHRLAHELALAGWKLQTVTTDNGSEFVSSDFGKVARRRWRPATAHQSRPPRLQTAASSAFSSRSSRNAGAQLRPLARPQTHRPAPRPRRVPDLLQHRQGAHRPTHPRPRPRRHRLRCPQDGTSAMTCRHYSGLAHIRYSPIALSVPENSATKRSGSA